VTPFVKVFIFAKGQKSVFVPTLLLSIPIIAQHTAEAMANITWVQPQDLPHPTYEVLDKGDIVIRSRIRDPEKKSSQIQNTAINLRYLTLISLTCQIIEYLIFSVRVNELGYVAILVNSVETLQKLTAEVSFKNEHKSKGVETSKIRELYQKTYLRIIWIGIHIRIRA
jgi:hypothetical protein